MLLIFQKFYNIFDHGKSTSISQLIKGKWRNLQKLLKYFNETTTSTSNVLLSAGALHIILVLYSKDLLGIVFLLFILLLLALSISFLSSFTSSL